MFTWDDFSHWGLAVRSIYVFNGLNITAGILQPQTLGMPIFNAFIVSLAGYKEGYMLCGMYFVYWVSLLLPVSRKKWNELNIVAVYSIILFAIVLLISHDKRPNLYNDANLAIITGALIAYLYMTREHDNRSNAVFIGGIMLLPHIKNVVGIVFALFVITFWGYQLVVNDKVNKKNKIKTAVIAVVGFIISIGLYILSKQAAGGGSFEVETPWCDP